MEVPRKLCKMCLSDLCVHCRYSYDGMCKPCKERPDVHKCIQIYNKHFECICCGQKQKKYVTFQGCDHDPVLCATCCLQMYRVQCPLNCKDGNKVVYRKV